MDATGAVSSVGRVSRFRNPGGDHVSFRSGEDVQSLIAELMNTPRPLLETVKRTMNYKAETGGD